MAEDNAKKPEKADIDAHLRRVFQPTLDEDIPDRFRDLLAQLKDKEASKSQDPGSNS